MSLGSLSIVLSRAYKLLWLLYYLFLKTTMPIRPEILDEQLKELTKPEDRSGENGILKAV